jgi:hypothetical protein
MNAANVWISELQFDNGDAFVDVACEIQDNGQPLPLRMENIKIKVTGVLAENVKAAAEAAAQAYVDTITITP